MTKQPDTDLMTFWHITNFARRDAGLPELGFYDARILFAAWREKVESEAFVTLQQFAEKHWTNGAR